MYWEKQCIYNCEIYVYLLNISKYNKDEQKKWGIFFFSYPIEEEKKKKTMVVITVGESTGNGCSDLSLVEV